MTTHSLSVLPQPGEPKPAIVDTLPERVCNPDYERHDGEFNHLYVPSVY